MDNEMQDEKQDLFRHCFFVEWFFPETLVRPHREIQLCERL